MKPDELRTFVDYNYWANDRLLDLSAKLVPWQLTEPHPVSFKTLRGTLVHVYGAEWVWRKRMQEGLSPFTLPNESEFPTLAILRQKWDAERTLMRALIAGMTEEKLSSSFWYKRTGNGKEFETPHWQAFLHVVNHGTQFRSEAAVILSGYGQSPGDIDFTQFVRLA